MIAPERIWAVPAIGGGWTGGMGMWGHDDPKLPAAVPFIRADLAPVWHRMDDPANPPPMDGTEILVYVGSSYQGGVVVAHWDDDVGWIDWDADFWEFTHWMPIPAPPTEEGA